MLLSSDAEAMYWCGRYVERAQALSRVVSTYQRLGMDLPGARGLDLRPLLPLVNESGGASAPSDHAALVRALVFDDHNPSSVLGALTAARENLRGARVVAPPELWQILNRVHATVSEASGGSEATMLEALESTLAAGERFEGERSRGMLRDAAYAFLTIGCQLERADMLLRTLGLLVPLLRPNGWERAFDDVRWVGLLDALGVTSMYRRTLHSSADLPRLLGLVLVAKECPRSLAFCTDAIARELSCLPRAGRVRSTLAVVEREGASLSRSAGLALTPDLLAALPSLEALHEAVRAGYFPTHAEAVVGAPRSTAPAAALTDPFRYLGLEHERADCALRVLAELADRAARGQPIDRADLVTVVEFLTDFAELAHHEKEESILTPELVAAGFDWYDGPLAAMRREHRQEHYFVRALSQLASETAAWSHPSTLTFVELSREFCRFMRHHMDHEQHDLFEQAARTLSVEAKDRMLAAFVSFDRQRRELPSAGVSVEALLLKYAGAEATARELASATA